MTVECFTCGTSIAHDMKFCPGCGRPAPEPVASPVGTSRRRDALRWWSTVPLPVRVACGLVVALFLLTALVTAVARHSGGTTAGADPAVRIAGIFGAVQTSYHATADDYRQTQDTVGVVRRHVERLELVETSSCPADFREAFSRYCTAWRGVLTVAEREPQNPLEAFATGYFNSAVGGERDGGLRRMMTARDQAFDELSRTTGELNAAAARYGARPLSGL